MKKTASNNSGTREVRLRATPQKFEIRSNADGSRTISGYAATFGDLSQDLGGFVERIQAGAFTKSLRDNEDVRCLFSHDDAKILGRVSSGTLQIAEDSKGLSFSCKLPNTSTANDLVTLMERGDVSQMSFGFNAVQDDWQQVGDQLVRTLIEVVLYEISVVGDPAYTSTSVSVRSCPIQLRSKLKRDWDDDTDADDDICNPDSADYDPDNDDCEDQDDDECRCDCRACKEDRCEECSAEDCSADNCECEQARAIAEIDTLRMKLRLAELRIKHEEEAETNALLQRLDTLSTKQFLTPTPNRRNS